MVNIHHHHRIEECVLGSVRNQMMINFSVCLPVISDVDFRALKDLKFNFIKLNPSKPEVGCFAILWIEV